VRGRNDDIFAYILRHFADGAPPKQAKHEDRQNLKYLR
jgi:hypothetical protein